MQTTTTTAAKTNGGTKRQILDEATKRRAVAMLDGGASINAVAKKFHLHDKTRLYVWRKQFNGTEGQVNVAPVNQRQQAIGTSGNQRVIELEAENQVLYRRIYALQEQLRGFIRS